MSHYDWERGTLIIPEAAWPKLRLGLVEEHDRQQRAKLARARDFHARLMAQTKDRSNFDYRDAWRRISVRGRRQGQAFLITEDFDSTGEIRELLFPDDFAPATSAPRQPQDADFPLADAQAQAFSCGAFGMIALDDRTRQLTWYVQESNNAVEDARRHPLAGWLFRELSRVAWAPGTGGVIVGNDEYNRELQGEGGGGNYVTASYGPLGKVGREIE